jgi:hypothetical protein
MKSHPRAEGTRGTTHAYFTRIGTERQFGGYFQVRDIEIGIASFLLDKPPLLRVI